MKKATTLTTIILSTVLLFFSFGPEVFSYSNSMSKESQDTEMISEFHQRNLEKNERFRREFGLKTEEKYVTDLLSNKNIKTGEKYGVVLTKEEEEELDYRIKMQNENLPLIKEFIKNNINDGTSANIYITQSNGGIINIGFKNLDRKRNILDKGSKLYYDNKLVSFFEAKYSEEELDQLHQKIDGSVTDLESRGIAIVSVVTNLPDEKVNITLKEVDQNKIDVLTNLFGRDMITIKQGESMELTSSSTPYTKTYGGLRTDNNAGTTCSIGYTATGGSNTYFITAGHCMHSSGEKWYQGGNLVATASMSHFGGSVDAAAMKIDPSKATYDFYAYGTPAFSHFSSAMPYGGDTVGEQVCASLGYTDQTGCGTLLSKNWSGAAYGTSVYLSGMRKASFTVNGGDSGSPTFNAYQLKGIVSGVDLSSGYPNGTIYTQVGSITNASLGLGVNPILGGTP